MASLTIAEAIPILEELNAALDTAYWEANSLTAKDSIYDCISAIGKEMSELNKLSIQDHDLTYELISIEFKTAIHQMNHLKERLENHIIRNTTLSRLTETILALENLI